MPTITLITEQRRAANRRNVFLDGAFAFGCNLNVIARFRLREGLVLTPEQVDQILAGEVRQECFDAAVRSLESRLHGRAELKKKLMKKQWGESVVDGVLDDLTRMNYLDDAKFAVARATSAAKHKHHGRRRAMIELARKGIKSDDATRALDQVYAAHDSAAVAMQLAMKQAPRLRAMDPAAARRRLTGMLQRRGFDFDAIRPVIERVLGRGDDDAC
jgi:regulatory protein